MPTPQHGPQFASSSQSGLTRLIGRHCIVLGMDWLPAHRHDQPDAWLLFEYGIACPKGVSVLSLDQAEALEDAENDLTSAFRKPLTSLRAYLTELEEHVEQFSQEIEAIADREDVALRLVTISGIQPLGCNSAGGGRRERPTVQTWARLVGSADYSATLHRRKIHIAGVSKRGNSYVRRLLIHGTRSYITHTDRARHRWGAWLDALAGRVHVNKLTVALAKQECPHGLGHPDQARYRLPTTRSEVRGLNYLCT
ncbi:hypothetical protein [Xanthomonas arboricola]|uniref:hypothetical protein n=1 Tax=Xanthomonas arboricola TaxID=56448 RepID=UPI000A8F83D5|nr:hypothetical protein [Xanthomonas arboricola]